MALYHFWQSIVALLFGTFTWMVCQYLIRIAHNMFVTTFPQWAGMPHITFAVAIANWGLFLLVMIPIAFYLWTNTQRPEGEA